MPSAEEDHDHDLPCYTRRRSDYHRRWIFWAVNAAPRQIRRSCRRVRHRRNVGNVRVQTNRPETTLDTSAVSSRTVVVDWELRHCQRQQQQNTGSIAMLSTGLFCPRVPLLVLQIVAVFCLLLRLRVNVHASDFFIIGKGGKKRKGGAKKGRRHELRTRTETRGKR